MKHFLMFSLVIFVAACSPRQEPLNIAGGTYLGYQPFFLTQEILLCDTCPQSSNFIGGRPMNLHMLPSTTTVLRLFQAEELDGVLLTLGEAITLHQQSAANANVVFSGASIDLPRSLSDIYFFDRSNRNEMSTEKLNALIARFNDYKNIQAGGPALQRCDAQEGGV